MPARKKNKKMVHGAAKINRSAKRTMKKNQRKAKRAARKSKRGKY